jgi:uncharacterized BrkB/YihY/UPF0761 family membrane protein
MHRGPGVRELRRCRAYPVVRHTNAVYGAFATVLVVLAWSSLSVEVTVYAAELNVVLAGAAVAPHHRPATAHRS